MNKNNRQTGRVNYIWVLAGGYLWYLAAKIVGTMWKGEAGSGIIGVLAAVVFAGVGSALLYREWKAYQYGKAHIDDPETWSDAPEELDEKPEEPTEGEDHHGA